jgi:hypothetical protein
LKHGADVFINFSLFMKLTCNGKVGAKDCDLETPLHVAARGGHIAVIQELLSYRADARELNEYNQIPADVARTEQAKKLLGSCYVLTLSNL